MKTPITETQLLDMAYSFGLQVADRGFSEAKQERIFNKWLRQSGCDFGALVNDMRDMYYIAIEM